MSKEQKIVFRNGSSIECLPAGETVRGHRSEFPFIEWDTARFIPGCVLNQICESVRGKERSVNNGLL